MILTRLYTLVALGMFVSWAALTAVLISVMLR